MINIITVVGEGVRNAVLGLASVLKIEAAPGIATLFLLIFLVIAIVRYRRATLSRSEAVNWLRKLIDSTSNPIDFAVSSSNIERKITEEATNNARKSIATAWGEYRETLIGHEEDGVFTFRNSVRPSVFFNSEDLHFSPGFWRVAPSLFVSVGLLLTFLGLISALNSMNFEPNQVQSSLKDLLKIASAKFIMSLTGLFCSIVFTIILRKGIARIDHALHELCASIEQRLTFMSLEALAVKQLDAAKEQREHFKNIAFELVAELGRGLKEELPSSISQSISAAMAPLMQQVGQVGADGMSEMVKGLSSRLSDDVDSALKKASESLVQAGDRIALLSDRMDQSSNRVGSEIDSSVTRLTQAVEDLRNAMGVTASTTSGAFTQGVDQLLSVMNQTLEGIRDNTAEGARSMSMAAAEMREAVKGFSAEIESAASQGREAALGQIKAEGATTAKAIGDAGTAVIEAVGRTTKEISERSEQFAHKAGLELIEPLDRITEKLGTLTEVISEGAAGMKRLSDGVRSGAEATERAAGSFKTAAQDLVASVAPIRNTNERIEGAVSQLNDSTKNIANTIITASQDTAKRAAETLAAAQEVLGGEAKSIQISLKELTIMLDRLKGQGDRLDDIDVKLGKAFDAYTENVAKSVDGLFIHVRKIQEELDPALDTMRTIVEQAEQFKPESRKIP